MTNLNYENLTVISYKSWNFSKFMFNNSWTVKSGWK